MGKAKLYIDVDGVLLGERPGSYEVCLATGVREFLEYALAHFDCYWLTTRANYGDAGPALEALKPFASVEIMELAAQIKPTRWRTLKTEVFDFKGDFYWLDDQLFWNEREILESYGCLHRWIRVNTRDDLSDLRRTKQCLAELIQKI